MVYMVDLNISFVVFQVEEILNKMAFDRVKEVFVEHLSCNLSKRY